MYNQTVMDHFMNPRNTDPKQYPPDYYNSSIKMFASEKWKYDDNRKKYLEKTLDTVLLLFGKVSTKNEKE